MQYFRFIGAMVSEFRFFKKKKMKKKKKNMDNLRNHVYLYSGPHMTFSSIFWHAVTFSHVLHLDVLKGLKVKVKTEISLCMAIMQNNPLPSLYTQYYRTV